MMASKLIAIIAGVGPGTGASVARKFAATYPVVLLARSPENYESLAKEINSSGGKAIGISTDISDSTSVKNAVETIKKEFGSDVAAAVCLLLSTYIYDTDGHEGCYIQCKWRLSSQTIPRAPRRCFFQILRC